MKHYIKQRWARKKELKWFSWIFNLELNCTSVLMFSHGQRLLLSLLQLTAFWIDSGYCRQGGHKSLTCSKQAMASHKAHSKNTVLLSIDPTYIKITSCVVCVHLHKNYYNQKIERNPKEVHDSSSRLFWDIFASQSSETGKVDATTDFK